MNEKAEYFDVADFLEIYETYRGEKDWNKTAQVFRNAGFDSKTAIAAATRAAKISER